MDISKYTEEVTEAIAYNSLELESDGTLYCRVVGNQDKNSVTDIDTKSIEILKKLDYKPNVLMDLTYSGVPDSNARKLISQAFSKDRYNVMAIFGMNDTMRFIAKLIVSKVLIRNRIKMFKTEKEARTWLNANPAKKSK